MDAKPFRSRAIEDVLPSLHQRHKSTGNLGTAATHGAMTGFRGPAKRAAFGDMTNTVRHVGNERGEVKTIKPRASVAVLQRHALPATATTAADDKENSALQLPPTKNTKARQLPMLPTAVASTKNPLTSKRSRSTLTEQPVLQKPAAAVPADSVLRNERILTESRAAQVAAQPQPLQPRHFKSQPHLKPKTKLRKTASTVWDDKREVEAVVPPVSGRSVIAVLDEVDSPPAESPMRHADLQEPTEEEPRDDIAVAESPEPQFHEAQSGGRRGSQHSDMAEAEEYWDEDDYYYVDDDPNYTTAHSLRSKDLTTGQTTTVLAPKVTKAVQRELDEARREVERTKLPEDVEFEAWDISMVTEYGDEIFEYMQTLELSMLPNPDYMDAQTEMQWSMRSVLMDWLVQVHGQFNLLPETLFLTVNYIDRFLSKKIISLGRLQLVGATAILVASKYEEIHSPSLAEIIYMVDGGYSMDQLLRAERFMLDMLDFNLGWPGPMSFLRRVSKGDEYDVDTRTLAKYFLELTIMDERFVASRPSFLAAGAHCLARFVLEKGDWTPAHIYYSGYTWGQLKRLVTMMIGCCKHPLDHHSAIFKKYESSRFKYASLIVQDALDAGFTLPHQDVPVRLP